MELVKEIIEVEKPTFDSLDDLRGNYNDVIARAKEITDKEKLTTPEGKFVLTFLLGTANLINSAGPSLSEFKTASGENPKKEIDQVGAEIADILLPPFVWANPGREGTEIYIEEREKWETHPKGTNVLSGSRARMILVDPCDETVSPPHRSVAISIFDKEGKFLSGGVAGLKDEAVVFIEGGKASFVGFDGGKNVDNDPLYIKFAPGAPTHLKIATLNRRLNDEKVWESLRKASSGGLSVEQTLGGYALIRMLKGEIDVMIDTSKGQPWYEAAQWGVLAENLGFSVEYDHGKIPSAQYIMVEPTPKRIPIVISRNKEIHEKVLEYSK